MLLFVPLMYWLLILFAKFAHIMVVRISTDNPLPENVIGDKFRVKFFWVFGEKKISNYKAFASLLKSFDILYYIHRDKFYQVNIAEKLIVIRTWVINTGRVSNICKIRIVVIIGCNCRNWLIVIVGVSKILPFLQQRDTLLITRKLLLENFMTYETNITRMLQ